jgi:hypothetical protein
MSYSQAQRVLATTIASACPDGMPSWVGWLLGGMSAVAIGLDAWTARQVSKTYQGPTLEEKLADFYYRKAAEFKNPVNVTVNVGNNQTSRYLMEEGNTDVSTDCFSCASGHLAATKTAIERAKQSMKNGTCGDECRKWLNIGVQETAALLAKDWTDEKIQSQPEHKKRVLEKYRAEVRDVMTDMLGGNDQAQLINEAAGLIDETLRFTNSGDSLNHPEVDGRLKAAESSLAAAERMDIAAYDTETANKIRSIRQAIGNRVNTPEDLKMVRAQARDLVETVNKRVFERLNNGKISELRERTSKIYNGFKEDRKKVD